MKRKAASRLRTGAALSGIRTIPTLLAIAFTLVAVPRVAGGDETLDEHIRRLAPLDQTAQISYVADIEPEERRKLCDALLAQSDPHLAYLAFQALLTSSWNDAGRGGEDAASAAAGEALATLAVSGKLTRLAEEAEASGNVLGTSWTLAHSHPEVTLSYLRALKRYATNGTSEERKNLESYWFQQQGRTGYSISQQIENLLSGFQGTPMATSAAPPHAPTPTPEPVTLSLPVSCSLTDVALRSARAGVDLGLERAAKAWVRQGNRGHGFLSADCSVQPLPGVSQFGAAVGFDSVTPSGDVLFQRGEFNQHPLDTWFLRAGAQDAVRIVAPTGENFWDPVLADDASVIGWVTSVADPERRVVHHLHLRDLRSQTERTIELEQEWRAQLELLSIRENAGDYVVRRFPNIILTFDASGRLTAPPIEVKELSHVHRDFRRVPGGWVAWDSLEGRIAWSTPNGAGARGIPRMSTIRSVSVDPAGRRIAVGAAAANGAEAFVVVSAEDGTDLLRQELPRWAKGDVAFLGEDHLAISFVEAGRLRLIVLPAPAS